MLIFRKKISFSVVLVTINSLKFLVNNNISVLEACQYVGINLPRFCYHEIISVAGNCRMCLVELEKSPKPVVACAMPVSNNMIIITNSPLVKKARENILELLLINHPLDCPICDQGGECDLQDQTKVFGGDSTRFLKKKRSVEDKNFGLTIKTIMTRCIHCTRCVRFSEELTNSSSFGTLNRGGGTEIGSYVESSFISEISGNIIDLCPVGALTSKNYAFKSRPWELRSQETIDCTDSFGSHIIVNFKETEILRIQPKIFKNLNDSLISDKIRFLSDGVLKNRIQQIFKKEENKKIFKNLSTSSFLNNINSEIKNVKLKSLFIINENLDFETSLLLKSLKNKNFETVNISTEKEPFNNFYFDLNFLSKSKILNNKEIKSCLLLSINLNTECVILNTKLRIKYNQENLKIYGIGLKNLKTFPVIFININVKKLFQIFEGKVKLSNEMLKNKYFSIIFGSSIKKRIKNIYLLLLNLKSFCFSINLVNVELNSNSKGLKFLGIKNINSKLIKNKSQNRFFLGLEDNIFLRKLIYFNLKTNNFWLNTHGSSIALKFQYILPTLTFFETEKYYLNNDQKLQKTNIIFNLKNKHNIIEILIQKFKEAFNQNIKYSFWNYKTENILDKNSLKFNLIFKNYKKNNYKTIINNYPIKSVVEDFFLTNILTKNSEFLVKRSKENRKFFNDF